MAYKAQVHKTLTERVWEKVNRNGPIPKHKPWLGPCWPWTAYLDQKGYGRINIGVRVNGQYRNKLEFAHRIAFEIKFGVFALLLPDNCVLHKCDNPACVRPFHLWVGTREDNNKDRLEKGRYDTCPKGEENYRHKLTAEQVLEIRRICKPAKCGNTHNGPPKDSYTDLGKKYGVTYDTIRLVVLRKTWKHI